MINIIIVIKANIEPRINVIFQYNMVYIRKKNNNGENLQ